MSKFENRLSKKGLEESTQQKYADIIESAGNKDLVDWIHSKVKDNTPLGTVLPLRAAVKHYLISEMGYSSDDVDNLLPKAEGQDNRMRSALAPKQLATYHAAVDRIVPDPSRTILNLLPMTGLKISEICDLTVDSLHLRGDKKYISLPTKAGKRRIILLNRTASSLLQAYMEKVKPKDHLFGITPHGVRKYTRKLGEEYKDLDAVSPEVLRVTYAVLALKQGTELEDLRASLGHQNLATTRRYLDQVV